MGSVITAVTANDVDTNPALTYSLTEDSDVEAIFSIDRFSGKITLCRALDYETRPEYRLKITASDTAHTAHTVMTVKVTDDNDNLPVFTQPSYQATLPGQYNHIFFLCFFFNKLADGILCLSLVQLWTRYS